MAMGKRRTERQQELWIAATDLPDAPGHPFYRKLNALLDEHGFDGFVEPLCQKFYHDELGRPSVPPLESSGETPVDAWPGRPCHDKRPFSTGC